MQIGIIYLYHYFSPYVLENLKLKGKNWTKNILKTLSRRFILGKKKYHINTYIFRVDVMAYEVVCFKVKGARNISIWRNQLRILLHIIYYHYSYKSFPILRESFSCKPCTLDALIAQVYKLCLVFTACGLNYF